MVPTGLRPPIDPQPRDRRTVSERILELQYAPPKPRFNCESSPLSPAPYASQQLTRHPASTVPLTIHSFPALEPVALESYPTSHLHLPLRRDLLHLAITHEGSTARQGSASSKTRYEVHGSHRKVRPQKGTGRARMGTRQSPINRGGGKTFGPHPRDFSNRITRKVYDKAWRTALSYRYRRGELVVCADGMELPLADDFWVLVDGGFIKDDLRSSYLRKHAKQLMDAHDWGRTFGRTLFVTSSPREVLFEALGQAPEDGRAIEVSDVDVKDLLTEGRVVVEREALRQMIAEHQSDLTTHIAVGGLMGLNGEPLASKAT
jgi:large subunit ribosomal protein L4